MTTLRSEAAAREEAIRTDSTTNAGDLRKVADAAVAGIREWSKAELARQLTKILGPGYDRSIPQKMIAGRSLNDADLQDRALTCLLSADSARRLFGAER